MLSEMLTNKMLRCDEVYIYGKGIRANRCYGELKNNPEFSKKFKGYILTNTKQSEAEIAVFSIDEVSNKEALILLALKEAYSQEVSLILREKGYRNYLTYEEMGYFRGPEYEQLKAAMEDDYPQLLTKWYLDRTHQRLDLNNPITYNEKLQWLKLYDNMPQKKDYVDKYTAKKIVEERIGKKYVVPLLGVWDSYDDIDFNKLPSQFVLKCTHGCKWNRVVVNKDEFDIKSQKSFFDAWMKTNFAYFGLELQYRDIKPRIIAEELLIPDDGQKDLSDYKIFVFDGVARLIQVDFNRFSSHTRDIYNIDWQKIEGSICYPNSKGGLAEKPEALDEMIRIAEALGAGFKHVRVDLYYTHGKIYFGELTFTHGNGIEEFSSRELAEKMGDWIKIDNKK